MKQLCEIHSLVKRYHDTLPEKCGFRSLEDITNCGRRSLVVIRFMRKVFTCQWKYRVTICVFCSLVKQTVLIKEELREGTSEKSEKIIAFHVHLSKDMFTR